MSDLALLVKNVDRHEDHAQFDAGQIKIDDLDAIGEVDAEAVTRTQAASRQEPRYTVAARIDFPERELLSPKFERDRVAPSLQRKVEEICQIHKYLPPHQGVRDILACFAVRMSRKLYRPARKNLNAAREFFGFHGSCVR